MLSIIISSYQPHYYTAIESNIAKTIGDGLVYEIIQVKNPGTMGLCEAYNIGLERSRYSYALFLHEDVHFNSNEWGNIIKDIFSSDANVGLIGIAGGLYKTKAPSAWWDIDDSSKYVHVRHSNGTEIIPMRFGFGVSSCQHVVRVLTIDGVFIALRRSTGVKFNEHLKGFHQYDLGISMDNHLRGYTAVCTDLIDITHYSMGNIDHNWVESADKFFDLYSSHLPLSIETGMTKEEMTYREKKNYTQFVESAWRMKLDKIAKKYWWQFLKFKPFSKKPFKLFKKLRQDRLNRSIA